TRYATSQADCPNALSSISQKFGSQKADRGPIAAPATRLLRLVLHACVGSPWNRVMTTNGMFRGHSPGAARNASMTPACSGKSLGGAIESAAAIQRLLRDRQKTSPVEDIAVCSAR